MVMRYETSEAEGDPRVETYNPCLLKSGAAGSACVCVIETCPLTSCVVCRLHFAASIIAACDAVT